MVYEERILKTLINTIVEKTCHYLNDPSLGEEKELLQLEEKLMSLFAIYDSTDWRFIKEQSTGKIIDNKEWIQIYQHYIERYSKVN